MGLQRSCRTNCWPMLVCLRNSAHALARPWADTLNGSKHANMKELRFDADNGVWRVAFAFDPSERQSCLSQVINQA